MMYGTPEHFELDFIVRSIDILKNYNGEYETTLLINLMVGLLILPREKHINDIDDSMIEPKLLNQVLRLCSDKIEPNLSVGNVARRMRNAIAHGHLVFEAEKDPYGKVDNEIKRISFYDDKQYEKKGSNYNRYDFKASFEIQLLREFVLCFSNAILKKCGGTNHV